MSRTTTNKLRHSDSGNCWIARITAWWILWRFGWRRRTIKIPWCGTVSEFAEPLIRGDEKARFRSCYPPQFRIGKPLRVRSANVFHIVAECTQSIHRHARDVLIHKNPRPSHVHGLKGSHQLLG